MSLLVLDNVKKHFAAQEVLSGASFRIDPGEKVGLVGRNGGGKTTLLRLIEGLDAPDWGSIRVRKGCDLGFVPQNPEFAAGVTVRDFVETGLHHVQELVRRYEELGVRMGEAGSEEMERLMTEHERLGERIGHLGGWEIERKVETVLSGIGLEEAFWEREARTLSGGERSRTALARALVAGHDMLLLDEPTNHLDLEGIEWIEDYIRNLEGAVLVVSHDRRLLENAVNIVVELERGKLVRYSGNYSKYIQLKEERYESEFRAWSQQQDLIRKETSFIKKHMGSQRTAEAKGRQKKLRHIERLEQPFHDVRKPVIRAPKAARGGELVLTAEELSAGYGDRVLFEETNLRIGRGQRIGIIGRNGTGKSTLLRILAGLARPRSGQVVAGHGALCGFYDQDMSNLREDGTPFSEIRLEKPEFTDLEVRSHLALFLFRGDEEIEKPMSALSGGERARLSLAKLVLHEPSWLAMDEPTNHLDLASRTALEEMLSGFEGALVCVSHDRAFLDDLCDHIIEVSTEGIEEFPGNYSQWRAHKLALEASAQERREQQASQKKEQEKRARAAAAKRKPATSKKKKPRNPYKLAKVEARIIELEEKLGELNESLTREEVYRDPERMRETQIGIAELERELAEANEEWEQWLA